MAKETLSSTTALLECPSCGKLADPWIELDRVVTAIDLLLNRPGVYRHLLLNESRQRTIRLLAVVVVADVYLRWSDQVLTAAFSEVSLSAILSTAGSTTASALRSRPSSRIGWAIFIGVATLLARLTSPRATLVPYALALSVLPSLGILTFALLWRDAFHDSASTLPRNALEHFGLMPLAQKFLDQPPTAFVLREAELKWLLVRVGVGGSAAVCAVSCA